MAVGIETPIDIAELRRRLRTANPAALLVPPRILRRVIKRDRRIAFVGLQVPHRKSYVIGRDALAQLVTHAELEIDSKCDLPPTVILISRPEPEALAGMPRGPALIKYWRLLFHARVHQALHERRLSEADVQSRLERIGSVECAEIARVLRQEKYLLPPWTEGEVFEEFAAVYLELRFFDPALLPHYFPSLDNLDAIDALLAGDVDAAELFEATRLAGAPDPVSPIDDPDQRPVSEPTSVDDSHKSEKLYRALLNRGDRAARRGNVVRAAIERFRAARLAPTHRQLTDAHDAARRALDRLIERLRPAIHIDKEDAKDWERLLIALLPRAARGVWPPEARLLYDLQKVCVDHERPTFAPDLAEWFYSAFRRPFVRPLPHQPLVLAVKHLRGARDRLTATRLAAVDRHALTARLHVALHAAEHRLRERLAPILSECLAGAGFRPQNYAEEVSRDKLIDELLDRIVERGFLNIGDVRDAVSRNQLKQPDLSGAVEFITGGPILRTNRRLADRAAGVYRRGEIYLRWLQRLSAACFGTVIGRLLMLYLVLPFGGAFATVVFAQEILHLLHLPHHLHGQEQFLKLREFELFHVDQFRLVVIGIGLFYLLLIHAPPFRGFVMATLRALWWATRGVFFDLPMAVYRWPPVDWLLKSRIGQFLFRCVVKPLPAAALAWAALWGANVGPLMTAFGVGATLIAVSAFVNSRVGRDLEEEVADWAARRWDYFATIVPGLVRLIADVFKSALESLDRGLYSVDEWLRFRGGQTRITLVFKTILGFVWSVIAYAIRLFVNVFIEPTVNPLKHFPAVTVTAKMLVPFWIPITEAFATPLMILGKPLAYTLATFGLHSLPGAAGFLVWELKENWRLYRANRPSTLRPVIVGHHGETLLRLMKPGIHSGTLPKLYAKLRKAERTAHRSGSWLPVRKLNARLHEVEESIRHFVERELLAFLHGVPAWADCPIEVGAIDAASNRIRIELRCDKICDQPASLEFTEHAGLLQSWIAEPGWQSQLTPEQLAAWTLAWAGFEQKAGVIAAEPIAWDQWVAAWDEIYSSHT
jgi:hypothetical protein